LGKLIQTGRPQHNAKGNDASIPFGIHFQHRSVRIHQLTQVPLMGGRVGPHKHGPKLKTQKTPAMMANTFLLEKNWPAGTATNQQCNDQRQRNKQWQSQDNEQNIHGVLPAQFRNRNW